MNKLKAILIGRGYWGQILIPYIKEQFELVDIVGKDCNIKELSKQTDIFIIATPIETHYKITKECLECKKHVMVEKPITTNYIQAVELKKLAEKNNVKLVVDYVEMFSPSKLLLKSLLLKIGELKSIIMNQSQYGRFGLESVDFLIGCHQLSILSLLTNLKNLKYKQTDIIKNNNYLVSSTICFNNNTLHGKIFLSLLSKEKYKEIVITGTKGVIHFNAFALDTIRINLYDRSLHQEFSFNEKDNLTYAIQFFSDVIQNKLKSNIDIACEITKILESI